MRIPQRQTAVVIIPALILSALSTILVYALLLQTITQQKILRNFTYYYLTMQDLETDLNRLLSQQKTKFTHSELLLTHQQIDPQQAHIIIHSHVIKLTHKQLIGYELLIALKISENTITRVSDQPLLIAWYFKNP